MKLIIINGPNLNLTGIREKSIYGLLNFDDYLKIIEKEYPDIQVEYFQSNLEGEIIDKLQKTGFTYDGIILNPGGYSHTSVAIADTLKAITTPVVEVHISNVFAREDFRHVLITARNTVGLISGFGIDSYRLAIEFFIKKQLR